MADVLNCKHCGGAIAVTGYCTRCGLKIDYVNKALNSSKYYYNIGLDKAMVRDMTGAEEALKLALKYDKMNIDARNLLGLVYYETGEIVQALSHWVVSVNYFDGKNVAKRYIKEIKSNPHRLEAVNNVTRKYNQALVYAQQGSKDLAFIQLRKVLSDNSRFIQGYLLLALLFIDEGRNDKAGKALKRVIKIDRTNPVAVRYFNEMGHTDEEIMNFRDYPEDEYDVDSLFMDDQKKLLAGQSEVDFDGDPIPVGRYKDINFYKYSIAYIIAGVVLGLAAMWTLIIPHRDKVATNSERDLKVTFSQEIADKNVSISELQSQVDSLSAKLTNAETETKNLQSQIDKYGDYSAQILSDDNKARVQSAIYKYEAMTYEAAIDDLNRVLQDNPNSDVALYYKAMCYLKLSDNNNATLVFNQLVENCPNSVYYTVACDYADADAIEAGKNKAAAQTSANGTQTSADGSQDGSAGDGTTADTSADNSNTDGSLDTSADGTDFSGDTGDNTSYDGTDNSGDGSVDGTDSTDGAGDASWDGTDGTGDTSWDGTDDTGADTSYDGTGDDTSDGSVDGTDTGEGQ